MSKHQLVIETKGTKPHVKIDGQDVAQHVSRVELIIEAGEIPEVLLTVPIFDGIEVDSEVITKILEEEIEERTAENDLKLPQPCEDVVSRQVAIEYMASAIWHYPDYMALTSYDNAHELAEYGLRPVPPIKNYWNCGACKRGNQDDNMAND